MIVLLLDAAALYRTQTATTKCISPIYCVDPPSLKNVVERLFILHVWALGLLLPVFLTKISRLIGLVLLEIFAIYIAFIHPQVIYVDLCINPPCYRAASPSYKFWFFVSLNVPFLTSSTVVFIISGVKIFLTKHSRKMVK